MRLWRWSGSLAWRGRDRRGFKRFRATPSETHTKDDDRKRVRYHRKMTGLLESALRRVESLSQEEQDAIAAQILETLDDEASWVRHLRERPELLRSLAREALDEHRRGETRPIDELLG